VAAALERHRARIQRLVAVALPEPERRVAERRRDRELLQGPALAVELLDVVDRGAAALLDQAERLVDVLDLEDQRADAVGVLAEEPAGAARAQADDVDRRAHHDVDVAGGEARRLLAALVLELRRAAPGLREVELPGVEPARALEIVDVVVDAFETLD